LAKVFDSSTSSGDVLLPPLKEPPCTHTMAGRLVILSLDGGWYMSSFSVTVCFDKLVAVPYVMSVVLTTVVKIGSR